MTDWTSVSREGAAAIFIVALLFTVAGPLTLQRWLQKGTRANKTLGANLIAALLGATFVGMLGAGAASFLVIGHKTFINLTLFIDGAIGLAVLLEIVVRFYWNRFNRTDEMRRVAAHDL